MDAKQFHKTEIRRIKIVNSLVKARFCRFGVNKKQEIARLLYEISKRQDLAPAVIAKDIHSTDYKSLKSSLLKIRFSESYFYGEYPKPYLPALKLQQNSCVDLTPKKFYPKKIFVEGDVFDSSLALRFKKTYPAAKVYRIDSLKEYLKKSPFLGLKSYNQRRDNVFITSQEFDFFKVCPCTKAAHGCGYHIFNLGFGCIFDCTYCYLQGYSNVPGIIFQANTDSFFDAFAKYKKSGMRLGTGEFSDSLMLDNITQYSLEIIEFFKNHPDVTFEFKTKSSNIANLLFAKHAGNIVVSWSLNPQKIIDENEFFSASLVERLKAASKCIGAGYKIGIHFDPIINFEGWQKEYENLIKTIFQYIKPESIAWISLGTFRFAPSLKPVIEARFPSNKILDGELFLGYDNKLRYSYKTRYAMYKFILEQLRRFSKNLNIYLCMEEVSMIKELL